MSNKKTKDSCLSKTIKENKCNKKKPIKTVKPFIYCGLPLECSGIESGDNLNTIIGKIDASICNGEDCSGFRIKLNPVHVSGYTNIPEVQIVGGTAPYEFSWTLQQTGGTSYTIGNPSAENYNDLINSMDLDQECFGTSGSGVPCRISWANVETDPTHVWHFKLEVIDANGCVSVDYWTHYRVNTY